MISRPTFLVGAERSGTTMFRLMLTHHPEIAWCTEFGCAVDWLPPSGWPNLETYYETLANDRIFLSHQFTIDKTLAYPELVDSFLRQEQQRTGKPVIGALVHRHFDRLPRIWPDARFIHMLRDGRDVARSCIGMGWAGNVWTGVERWIEAEQLWDRFVSTLTPDRWTEIRYENLVSNPVAELTRICQFLGVDYHPNMLSYAGATTYDKPDPKLIAQWRTKLSELEIRQVESRIANLLAARGYPLSGLPALEVSPAMQRRLRHQDYWARIQYRVKFLGPRLFVEDYIARHVGSKKWRARVKATVNAKVQAALK